MLELEKNLLNSYPGLVHASNIMQKIKSGKNSEAQKIGLQNIKKEYTKYLENMMNIHYDGNSNGYDVVKAKVSLLNCYYNFFREKKYDNLFSSQGKFRSTILEEFIYLLFYDVVKYYTSSNICCGSVKAYTNLFFSAKNLEAFAKKPDVGVNNKDQDFAIYRNAKLRIDDCEYDLALPIVSVECKTYVDKTMLEGAVATAEKLKAGNPYSLFFIVAENYDVSFDVDPAYSRIDQIYVLRKSTRKSLDREWKNISQDVVWSFFSRITNYLKSTWSDVPNKMQKSGIII